MAAMNAVSAIFTAHPDVAGKLYEVAETLKSMQFGTHNGVGMCAPDGPLSAFLSICPSLISNCNGICGGAMRRHVEWLCKPRTLSGPGEFVSMVDRALGDDGEKVLALWRTASRPYRQKLIPNQRLVSKKGPVPSDLVNLLVLLESFHGADTKSQEKDPLSTLLPYAHGLQRKKGVISIPFAVPDECKNGVGFDVERCIRQLLKYDSRAYKSGSSYKIKV